MIDSDVIARAPRGAQPGRARRPARHLHGARRLAPRAARRPGRQLLARSRSSSRARTWTPSLDHADGIHRADPDALEHLGAALTLSGIAMGVAGRTAPGSGMEHTVSHLLEMAERPGVEAPLHGAKVGALSVLAAMLWARVRTVARRRAARAALPEPATRWSRACARRSRCSTSPAAWARRAGSDYARKLERWNDARDELETLWQRWPAFDAELERCWPRPSGWSRRCARRARRCG